ncbi:MAG: hypothetical protein KIS66_05645 [Fimbriimonadaceae bacterium]|nr:hypothetical protein [Fimbriimonadaceae bacterium]
MNQPTFADLERALYCERRDTEVSLRVPIASADRISPSAVRLTYRPDTVLTMLGSRPAPKQPGVVTEDFEQSDVNEIDGRWTGVLVHVSEEDREVVVRMAGETDPVPGDKMVVHPKRFLKALHDWVKELADPAGPIEPIRRHAAEALPVPTDAPPGPSPSFPKARPSQRRTLSAPDQGLALLWGPPGTGKTLTMGALAADQLARGRRVLAVCPSNVAVDQLTLAIDDGCARLGVCRDAGDLLRIGRARHPDLVGDPARRHLLRWSDALSEIADQIRNLDRERWRIRGELRAKRGDRDLLAESLVVAERRLAELEAQRRQLVAAMIERAHCVVCTAHHLASDLAVQTRQDPILLVDEAGALPLPFVVRLLYDRRQFAVFAGDFRQLAPIGASQDHAAQRWFTRSVFELMGAEDSKRRQELEAAGVLRVLTEQSRMPPALCEVVSRAFYDGRLSYVGSHEDLPPSDLTPSDPLVWLNPHSFVRAGANATNPAPHKSGTSWIWDRSALVCGVLVDRLLRRPGIKTVAVLTPFNIQAKILEGIMAGYDPERVRTGTVHRMQGNEADAVVFDLVNPDTWFVTKSPSAPRLINVALSRARRQVFVVANDDLPKNGLLWRFAESALRWRLPAE